MNGDEAPQTEVKQLAGAEAPGPSHPSGGARHERLVSQQTLIGLVQRSWAHQQASKTLRIILIPNIQFPAIIHYEPIVCGSCKSSFLPPSSTGRSTGSSKTVG